MNKKTSEFAGRMSDAVAAAIFLMVACGAPIYSLFKKLSNAIKQKIQMVNGSNER